MPDSHHCTEHWGAPAKKLKGLLAQTTAAERAALEEPGAGKRPRKPYEGWVHRSKSESDYDSLVKLYYELCLAIKRPTDIPNLWGKSEVKGKKGQAVDAAEMGHLAKEVLKGLEKDGNEARPGKTIPIHTEGEVPRYGTPNWLEKPPETLNLEAVQLARALVSELRGAMAR